MSYYRSLTPEEAAEKAVGFLTRSLPIPRELQEIVDELGIGKYFNDDDDTEYTLTAAERELAAMGVDA